MPASVGAFISNRPFASVLTAMLDPLTVTVAPIRGFCLSSETNPETFFCENAIVDEHTEIIRIRSLKQPFLSFHTASIYTRNLGDFLKKQPIA